MKKMGMVDGEEKYMGLNCFYSFW